MSPQFYFYALVGIEAMASRRENRSDGSNDDSTDSAQKSDNKIKGQRGAKHKFKKIFKLSPPATPEPASDSRISVTEDDKTVHQDLTVQPKWADPVTPDNPLQTSPTPSPPSNVHVTDQYRPVTQRSPDYNTLNDMVSL